MEYVIWGVPKGESEEQVLISEQFGLTSLEQANKVMDRLVNEYGCTNCRVQSIDLRNGIANDFRKAINL